MSTPRESARKRLPANPSVENLKKQAKRLAKDQPSLSLQQAQHKLAKSYGFAHWDEMLIEAAKLKVRTAGPEVVGHMFNSMFPELFVSDCEAAAQFFEKALGYHRGYTLMENGILDFAVMQHPDPGLHLNLHHMLPAGEAAKPRYMRLYYEPKDIYSLCAQLRSKGFAVTEPELTDYGATYAHMDGPDGYSIWFQQWKGRGAAG